MTVVSQSLGHSVTRSLGHWVTWSLGHSVTRSLGHSITGHFSHSYVCGALGNDQQKYEWWKWPKVMERPNDRITEWPSDRVTVWPSRRVTKWPSDRETDWLSNKVTEWLNGWKWLSKNCSALFKALLYTIWKRKGETWDPKIQHLSQWHK